VPRISMGRRGRRQKRRVPRGVPINLPPFAPSPHRASFIANLSHGFTYLQGFTAENATVLKFIHGSAALKW